MYIIFHVCLRKQHLKTCMIIAVAITTRCPGSSAPSGLLAGRIALCAKSLYVHTYTYAKRFLTHKFSYIHTCNIFTVYIYICQSIYIGICIYIDMYVDGPIRCTYIYICTCIHAVTHAR